MSIKQKLWAALSLIAVAVFAAVATYASAQEPKHDHAGDAKMECPMMKDGKHIQVSAKAENTERGAIIRIQAKNTAELADVQQMAQTLAKHLEEGCPLMSKHKHGGGHSH